MKKVLLLALVFISLYSCRPEKVDGIWIQTDIEFDYIASNPMVANETWTNTTAFNMKAELLDRYGIDLTENELLSFKILGAKVLVNSSQCQQLSEVKTIFDFPEIDPFTKGKAGQDLQDECDQDALGLRMIDFDENSTDADVQEILATDFGAAINRGETLKVKYSMTAAEDFDSQNSAITVVFITKTQYLPK